MSKNWLQQKALVVIGGTSGIGLAAARAFIAHGANVVIVGKEGYDTDAVAGEFSNRAEVVTGDAAEKDTAEKAIALCVSRFKDFHGLYHVAGGSGRKFGDGPLHELTLEGWNSTFQLNLTSLMLSNQAAIRAFLDRKTSGTVLNMCSVLAFSPSPRHFATHAYSAAKSAVVGFSKAIAAYYASKDIRINVLAPALVETPMSQRAAENDEIMRFIRTKQPLSGGRIGFPGDLEGAALYFMSDYSRFTTGQVLAVDGGWSITEGQY